MSIWDYVPFPHTVCYFPSPGVTSYCKLGGLKRHKRITLQL